MSIPRTASWFLGLLAVLGFRLNFQGLACRASAWVPYEHGLGCSGFRGGASTVLSVVANDPIVKITGVDFMALLTMILVVLHVSLHPHGP